MSDIIAGKQTDWLSLTRNAASDAEQYFNAGVRREIEQDVRQFQGLHPANSKYLSDAFKARSKFFAPKTRATIRKNEAVAANALFSNSDVIEVTPWDDSDKMQQAGASLMKEWLNLRLKRTLPWFQLSIGAYQEAQAVGSVCAYLDWKVDKKRGIDEPSMRLIPLENILFSPSASWIDPVNTSPYWVEKIPMYVKDVQARCKTRPDKGDTSKWLAVSDEQILTSVKSYSDSIRLAREQGRADSQAQASALRPYQTVWVYRNIADVNGEDYLWYTLGESALLSNGTPLVNSYWHGMRPYVLGNCVIEAHKIYPPGVARLTRDLQGELNENRNQRSDNVKFAMNKRYFAKRGAQVDIRSMTRNVPSSVTLMNDPEKDVKIVETKDVTSSAYQEQDRLNNDFDELAGSNSLASKTDNDNLANKVGGAEMLSEDANQIQGYQLRTFVETWVEPVGYMLMRLGQHYETDEDILKLCAQKADLASMGIINIDEGLIMQDLSLSIHVGIGSTSPRKQLDNLMFGLKSLKDTLEGGELQQLGLDVEEIATEVFSKLGYKSAERFFKWNQQDPNILYLQNQVQQLQSDVQSKGNTPEIIAGKVALLQAQVKKTLGDAFNVNVEGLFGAMQAAEVVAGIPAVAPVADTIAKAAGYEPPQPAGQDPGIQPVGGGGPAPAAGAPPPAAPPAGAGQSAPAPGAPAAGPAPGVVINPKGVMNPKTGIGFHPGAAPGGMAGPTGKGALPPDVQNNTHPLHPANPGHPDVGTHAGIEGGSQSPQDKMNAAMHMTLQQINHHLCKPKPALNIHTPEGKTYRVEPDEGQQ